MNSLKKNALLNIIKQICTVVFPLITFPYAARVLHTDNYGTYTFSASIISYITLLAGLGVSNYAVREGARIRKNNKEVAAFSNQIFTINVFSTIISLIVLFILTLTWNKLNAYKDVIWILSLGVVFTTLGTDWINIIFEDYTYISVRYIICQFLAVILLFIIVKNEHDVEKYAFVTVFGTILANLCNVYYIRKKYRLHPTLTASKEVIIHLLPILVLFGNSIAQTIYINSDVTILGVLTDDNAVGLYGVASRIYLIVKGIANAAIYVIIPRVASLIAEEKKNTINEIYKSTLGNVILVTIPVIAGLLSLSSEVVTLIAGKEYIIAAQPLCILSVSLLFAVVSCFYVNGVLVPYRKEKHVLIFTITSAAINILLNFILIPRFSYNAAAFTTLISELVICVCGVISCKKLCEISIKRDVLISCFCGLIVFLCCYIVKIFSGHYIPRIILSILSSVVLYIVFLCIVKSNFVYDLIMSGIKKIRKE